MTTAGGSAPGRLVDDLGVIVDLDCLPRRVESLVPSLTEAIAATRPETLIGITDWCPSPGGLEVTRVRGPKNPDLATIKTLRPDLLVANQEENRLHDVERLRAAGVPVWVTRVNSVDEAFASLRRLLIQALGLPEPGWLLQAEADWARPSPATPLRVAVPVWREPWLWVGSNTFAHDLMTKLGWTNTAAAFGARYPEASPNDLLAQRPDVVLLPDEPYSFGADDGPEVFGDVPTRLVPGRALFWFGPAMAESRQILEAAVGSLTGH